MCHQLANYICGQMDTYLKDWEENGIIIELVKMLRTTSVMNGKDIRACCLVVGIEGIAVHLV